MTANKFAAEHHGIGMTSQRTRDRLINRLRDEGIKNEEVLEVMRYTPRHLFVDEALSLRAYEDTALPIGHGQTISQPYMVARMTEVLLEEVMVKKLEAGRVLEIGTGSGYQTAVLAQLFKEVYSVERISALQGLARERLFALKLSNVRFKHSDGSWGWPEQAGFDAIIVTAAPEEIPENLLRQLNDGAVMIIPVGEQGETQTLYLVKRKGDRFKRVELDPVSFVPLLSGSI
ncbi:MAG: protein-L-isoaspartate(D-aspartate) O-methyltransferase [Gammaproteobacteria bacterium]|nr:protein-L-isoaspartate(D-aspartate) O-methyltransferase [Gammaproteobacteria bacterium]